MKNILITLLLMLLTILTGCDRTDNKEISVSETAVRSESGEVLTREPTKKELDSLEAFHNKYELIEKKYPGPSLPMDERIYSVVSIDDNGVFTLDDNTRIKMTGISCDSKGVDNIRKFFIEETDKLAYIIDKSFEDSDVINAYIWEADFSFMNDPELKELQKGPDFSSLNDTVILNSWCEVDLENPSMHNQRYLALKKIIKNNDEIP